VKERNDNSKTALIIVYNAGSGLFNALADVAHKIFAPQTYPCNLCALTHSTFGMRQEWKQFLDGLNMPFEFLHADELRTRYRLADIKLPAIFKKDERLKLMVDADSINACRTIADLKQLIIERLNQRSIGFTGEQL
jgi:hypothetical protein